MTVRIRSGAPIHTECKSKADDLAWNEEVAGALPATLTNNASILSRGYVRVSESRYAMLCLRLNHFTTDSFRRKCGGCDNTPTYFNGAGSIAANAQDCES
jgi:hypothetical protein